MKKLIKVLFVMLLAVMLSAPALAQAAAPTVTMKFPAGNKYVDSAGNSVYPDTNGNATVPLGQLSNYLNAGFVHYSDYLPEGATNLFFTNARARAALSSSATGLSYNSATGVFSLTANYAIPQYISFAGPTAARTWTGPDAGAILLTNQPGEIAALAEKGTPGAADFFLLEDSAASNAKKMTLWSDIKSTLTTYFNTLYSVKAAPTTVYAGGTAYGLTNSPAAVTFGTTSPAITVPAAGTYLIRYRAHVEYAGATFAANQTATLKLRRTNNTAADLTNSPATAVTDIVTTVTGTLAWVEGEVVYTTANTNDAIALYGSVATAPSVGALNVAEANIIAQQLY